MTRSSSSEGCGGSADSFVNLIGFGIYVARNYETLGDGLQRQDWRGCLISPSSAVIGRPEGTRVRSSSVEGRRREVGSSVDGRASNGTRDRGIIARLFSDGETQANPPPDGCPLVGRARRVPGCMPLRELPVQVRHAPPCRWFWVLCAYATASKNASSSARSGSDSGAGNFSNANSGCGPGRLTPTRRASRRA